MKAGDLVWVRCGNQKVLARVSLASSNGKSLVLTLADDPLRTPSGGMYLQEVPILLDDDGFFRDLIEGMEIRLEPVRSPVV